MPLDDQNEEQCVKDNSMERSQELRILDSDLQTSWDPLKIEQLESDEKPIKVDPLALDDSAIKIESVKIEVPWNVKDNFQHYFSDYKPGNNLQSFNNW